MLDLQIKCCPRPSASGNILSSGPTYHMLPSSPVNNCIILSSWTWWKLNRCFFIKLGSHVNHSERMDPFDFGGVTKVKVTIDIYGNIKLVNKIETKPLCASSSNLADMLAMVSWWIYWFLRSNGKAMMSIINKCGVRVDAKLCVVIFFCIFCLSWLFIPVWVNALLVYTCKYALHVLY